MKNLIIMIFLYIFILAQNLLAHPNTTINYRIFFKFDGLRVTDVGENWTFDKITSQELISKYNLGKKTTFNKKESLEAGQKIMDGLEEVRYFTYIFVNDHDLGKIKASGFKAQIKNSILSVAFNNHLPNPIDLTKNKIKVQVKDVDSTVITNLLEKKPVILIGISKEQCKITIEEKRPRNMFIAKDIYMMDMFSSPKEVQLKCKNKK